MLDEKDLQAIAQLMDSHMDAKLTGFRQETVAMMEAYFDPKFNLLADGQKTILEKKKKKNRVDQLEAEVDFLKTIIRSLSRDVAELKKAQ